MAFLAAVTLLPAILMVAGPRGWLGPRKECAAQFWRRIGVRVVRHPARAADFTIELPDLSGVDPDRVAGRLLPRFFAVWEEDETFVALLRAAMTSRIAADTLRQLFAKQVALKLITATPDHFGLPGAGRYAPTGPTVDQ